MTLPASGNPISFSQVDVELGFSSTAQISLNDTAVRTLFGVASGAIGMNTGYGKANCAAPGSVTYSTPGTYTWYAPAGVHHVSVVAVGAGGGGNSHYAGAGGGLGWKNNISVSPGSGYSVVVGSPGTRSVCTLLNAYPTAPSSCYHYAGGNGGSSSFAGVVAGYGGQGALSYSGSWPNNYSAGGQYLGDGGGRGGYSLNWYWGCIYGDGYSQNHCFGCGGRVGSGTCISGIRPGGGGAGGYTGGGGCGRGSSSYYYGLLCAVNQPNTGKNPCTGAWRSSASCNTCTWKNGGGSGGVAYFSPSPNPAYGFSGAGVGVSNGRQTAVCSYFFTRQSKGGSGGQNASPISLNNPCNSWQTLVGYVYRIGAINGSPYSYYDAAGGSYGGGGGTGFGTYAGWGRTSFGSFCGYNGYAPSVQTTDTWGGQGGSGVVRILWQGTNRSFPCTSTGSP